MNSESVSEQFHYNVGLKQFRSMRLPNGLGDHVRYSYAHYMSFMDAETRDSSHGSVLAALGRSAALARARTCSHLDTFHALDFCRAGWRRLTIIMLGRFTRPALAAAV